MHVRFSIFCLQCCRTARELFFLSVVLRRHATNGKVLLLMGDVAYDARFSVCNKRYTQDIIIRLLVMRRLNQCIPKFFGKNYCRKTIEATTVKKVPNERKLIYAIYNFIVAS